MIIRWHSPVTLAVALWHAFLYWKDGKPVVAPPAIRAAREKICAGCRFQTIGNMPQCVFCTCFIETKVLLSSESCPVSKWKFLTFKGKPSKTGAQP